MSDPTLSPGVLKRLGRALAEALDGALDHADLPEPTPAELSFDCEARLWLAEFERQHEAQDAAR